MVLDCGITLFGITFREDFRAVPFEVHSGNIATWTDRPREEAPMRLSCYTKLLRTRTENNNFQTFLRIAAC